VEDSVINAHRTILCAASKVMSNNFGGAGTEKTTFIEFDYTKNQFRSSLPSYTVMLLASDTKERLN
jgi:hypothetical protein